MDYKNTDIHVINNRNYILDVSSTSAYPGRNSGGMVYFAEGMEESEKVTVWEWRVNEHLVNTLGFELIQGRDVAVGTIAFHAYKAANTNPVDSLRHD